MRPVATVLYEDRMLPNAAGDYSLHDLVLRVVEDAINVEGLLHAIQDFDRELMPTNMQAALRKSRNDRDIILNEARRAARRPMRAAIREAQFGLAALADLLAALCSAAPT